jgi:hypothetical protein
MWQRDCVLMRAEEHQEIHVVDRLRIEHVFQSLPSVAFVQVFLGAGGISATFGCFLLS